MTLKIGNSQSSNNPSVSNPAKKLEKEKLLSNSAAENEAAITYLANRNPAPPVNFSSTDGDGKITAADFLRKVKTEQPFDGETLSKKPVRVFIDVKKSVNQTTVADYDKATWRAIFKQAGYGMLTDKEIETAVGAMNAVGWTTKDSGFDLASLRAEDAKPGAMVVKTNQAVIERAKRSGQAVLQYQEYKSKEQDFAVERGKIYVNQAIGGFVQPIVNAPVNIVNGISEPLRAGEKLAFGTNYIPEIPKMSVAEQSEYWNKDGRLYANKGAEIVSTITFGGALGSRALATQTGRVLTGVESGYNIAAGLTGKDVTQTDAQGNARQMEWLERGTRLAGGLFGARQTVKEEISAASSAVNKLDDIFKNNKLKPQAEAVTNEGIRVTIENNIDEVSENTFLSEKISETSPLGRRNLDSHEGVSGIQYGKQIGHTILKHVCKSERWLQDRIRREGIREASSFYNETIGNRTVGRFIKENREAIEEWIKNGTTDKFRATIDMQENIGIVVNTNKKGTPLAAEEATKATIILVKDTSEYGWHLLTVMLKK